MSTDIANCNTALLLANASQINSFSDETREAAMCSALYGNTRDSLLQRKLWSFSLFQEVLARTTNTPEFDWDYEFQLPTGYLRVAKKDNLGNDYRIMKDKLLTNQTAVKLLFQKDPGEEFYPAYFTRLIELKMAELLSLSLVQDEQMASMYEKRFLIAMREARGIDSQNNPTPTISSQEFSLTAVRGTDS